jgi:peptidoglycan/LPS O-acetylase OafA/YrhL
MKRSSRDRLFELDALRGFAACGIMLYHYTIRYGELFERPASGGVSPESPWGQLAVHLFFMISGFVIFMTLERTRRPLDFVVSRFSRLYPVYWAAVLVTSVVLLAAPLPGRTPTLGQALINLTMLQRWLRTPSVDGVYWTLAVELAFYAIMLGIYGLGRLSRIERLVVPCLIAQAIAAIVVRLGDFKLPAIVSTTFLVPYAHLFIAGIIFFHVRGDGLNRRRIALLAGCLGVHALFYGFLQAVAIALLFGVFLLMAFGRLGFLAARPVVFLGGISYSLYLIHQNIGYVIIRALHGLPMSWRVAVAILVSLGLATLLSRTIEQPALRALRLAYARYREAREPVSRAPSAGNSAALNPSA